MSFGQYRRDAEAERRREQIADFAKFCSRQRARVSRRFEHSVERIEAARWKAVEGEEMTLVAHRRA